MTIAEPKAMLALPTPMEARAITELPDPPGWQYEPKWDGFRAIVGRDGNAADILSKSASRSPASSPKLWGCC
ncbi:hypothetical protein [Sphingobium sp.]|uniref:hypothetical protein n=1 Tax=Sphingobium sp. TaxID=1912891 RepID=UPI0028BE16DA|nr:hypothetical protein [Sphingobium sp.]